MGATVEIAGICEGWLKVKMFVSYFLTCKILLFKTKNNFCKLNILFY